MDLRDYLRMLARSWVLIVGLTAIGAAVGGGAAAVQQPVYQSTAKAFVSTSSGQSLADLNAGAGYLQAALKGYADIATTAYVLRPVISELGLRTTPAELADRIEVVAGEQEAILQITASDGDAARAARIANAVTSQLSQAVVDLTPDATVAPTTGAAATPAARIELVQVDPALAPTSPTSPVVPLAVLLGAIAGLVLAVVIALLRELLDTRVHSRDDLERVTDLPLLGTTSRSQRAHAHPLVILDAEGGPQAEEYRTIRTNLRFVRLDAENPSIVVTSPTEREGKSTVAANLALAVARLGDRVLLIDADLRRPRLASVFGLEDAVGLSEVVIGAVPVEQAIQRVEAGPIDVLLSGAVPPNANELLQSGGMDDLLEHLRGEYDLVVIDSPPLLAVSDAVVLSTRVGGTLMVSAAGRSRRGHLRQALAMLERADAHVLGVVLTMVPTRSVAEYGYGLQPTLTARRTLPEVERADAAPPADPVEPAPDPVPVEQRTEEVDRAGAKNVEGA